LLNYIISINCEDKQLLPKMDSLDLQYFCSNSVLKFISDLFSTIKTKNTTSIFYSNDYNVLLDIIIRKLSNLSAEDQVLIDLLKYFQSL
jgi:hypothetical protein